MLKIVSDDQIVFESDGEDEPPAKKVRHAEPAVPVTIQSNSLDVKRERLDESSRRDGGSVKRSAEGDGSSVSRIIAFVSTLTSRMLWQLSSEQTRAWSEQTRP